MPLLRPVPAETTVSEYMSSSWSYVSSARARMRSYMSKPESHHSGSPRRFFDPHDRDQVNERTSWRAWISEKRRDGFGLRNPSGITDIQVVNIFPGWAARRYVREGDTTEHPPQFEVEVFVSGFACSKRDPENATRSQRAFLRLAKSFAGLPKVAANVASGESSLVQLTPRTEERLSLVPQSRIESDPGLDIETLDRELNRVKQDDTEDGDLSETPFTYDDQAETPTDKDIPVTHLHVLRRLHDNLEKRMRYLWYTALPNRTVRLHFFLSPHKDPVGQGTSLEDGEFSLEPEDGFLTTQDVTTGADGSFQTKIRVKWDDLCHHPRALHLAFGETIEDHDLLVAAKLLPQCNRPSPSNLSPSTPQTPTPAVAPRAAITRIPITHSPVRVISDIDDTVKLSGISSGARAAFHNVFVKDLKDNVIPGMGEWYTKMFTQGVRFHYVSNGPFAVLPILNDFFHISQLPSGSLKLKSYAGRSIFDGLLSAPATRKRSNVLEILLAFPDSLFFLIGDTGEQDLELYADLARERPDQIIGVFLRDARPDGPGSPEPLSDPTGSKVLEARNSDQSPPIRAESPTGSLASLLRRFPSYRTKDSIWRTASLPTLSVANPVVTPNDRPSRPTRFTVDSVRRNSDGHAGTKENSHGDYFGFGPLTSQPEEQGSDFDSFSNSAPISPTSLGHSSNHPSPEQPTVRQVLVTEPPKPIPYPSITIMSESPAAPLSLKRAGSGSSTSSDFDNLDTQNTGQAANGTLRDQLQKRVYRARKLIPRHIVLRVFGDPSECVEVDKILLREGCTTHND